MKRTATMCTTALLMLALGAAAHSPATPAVEREAAVHDVRLELDVSSRVLQLFQGGSLVREYPVAVGSRDHPTPRGRFRIDRIVWNPGWVPPDEPWAADEPRRAPDDPENPMVGAKLFFKYPDYYIHGTNAPETLGTAASHGCIRMRPSDVMRLGRFIQTHGGARRSDAWFDEVTRNDRTSHQVRLPRPIPLSIRD